MFLNFGGFSEEFDVQKMSATNLYRHVIEIALVPFERRKMAKNSRQKMYIDSQACQISQRSHPLRTIL